MPRASDRAAALLVAALCITAAPACKQRPARLEEIVPRLESSDPTTRQQGFAQLGGMLNQDEITQDRALPLGPRIVHLYDERHAKLATRQRADPPVCGSWVTHPDYAQLRIEAELLIDLLGFVRTADAETRLRDVLTLQDRHLKFFAARSLLRLGQDIDTAVVADLALGDEDRCALHDALAERGKADRIPQPLRTQQAFARGDLVRWLTYPTELGCEPHHIEYVETIAEPDGDFFVFRFTTEHDREGVPRGVPLAGIAGPYPRDKQPTTGFGGATTSDFHPWSDSDAAGHVRRMLMHIDPAARRRVR